MAYDDSNVFAKILRGELPAHKVYEDADTLAFMDIMPRCDGHVLVIPKTPARNVLDASPEQLAAWQAMCEGPPRCPHHLPIPGTDLMHCAACGCPDWKARLATTGCPLGRTPASPLLPPSP